MGEMKYSYAHQNLSMAMGDMASSSDPLRRRLESAFVSHLLKLGRSDFPDELWSRFRRLRDQLTSMSAAYEGQGTLQATLQQLHPMKFKGAIRELSSIEFLLAHVYFEESSERPIA